MSKCRLMRTWYKTDAEDDEPDYVGAFSDPFTDASVNGAGQVVAVDWSERGVVEVTWLIQVSS